MMTALGSEWMRKFGKLNPADVSAMALELIGRAERLRPQELPGSKQLALPEFREAIKEISAPRQIAQ